MKNRTTLIITGLALLLAFFLTSGPVLAAPKATQDKNLNGFVIQVRQNKHTLKGGFRRFIKAEELGPFFGINVRSLNGGKAAMIGHMYYDYKVRPYKGSAYLDAKPFFDFFNVEYTKFNDWTYRLKFTSIPMFNQIVKRYNANGSVRVAGQNMPMPVLMIKNRKYAELETLLNALKISKTTSGSGQVSINGKPVPRWISYRGKVFVYVEDAGKASGKSIK